MNHTAAYHQGASRCFEEALIVVFIGSIFNVAAVFKTSFHTLLDFFCVILLILVNFSEF